mmetsp:Transcript_46721/g.123453  ORF Transcript_46721/g.123453 Transcript_46721/m.123453 type:complete len:538 (-) Transcript_46721:361-1974(-)
MPSPRLAFDVQNRWLQDRFYDAALGWEVVVDRTFISVGRPDEQRVRVSVSAPARLESVRSSSWRRGGSVADANIMSCGTSDLHPAGKSVAHSRLATTVAAEPCCRKGHLTPKTAPEASGAAAAATGAAGAKTATAVAVGRSQMGVARGDEIRQRQGQIDTSVGHTSSELPASAKHSRVDQRRSCATAQGPNPAVKIQASGTNLTRFGSADEAAGTPAVPRLEKKAACNNTPTSKATTHSCNLPGKCGELEKIAADAAAGPQALNLQNKCSAPVDELQPEAKAKLELAITSAEAAVVPATTCSTIPSTGSLEQVDFAEAAMTSDDRPGSASETVSPAEKSKQAAKNARRRQRAQAKARAEAAELGEIEAAIVSSESAARRDARAVSVRKVLPRAALRDVDGMSSAAVCAHGSMEIATTTSIAVPRCAWPRPRRQRDRRTHEGEVAAGADNRPITGQQVGDSCSAAAGRGVKTPSYSDVMFSIAIARKYAPALSSGRVLLTSRREDVSRPGSSAASSVQVQPSLGLMAFGSLSSSASRS